MVPVPGSWTPSTAEMRLADSIPWAMRPLKNVWEAYCSFRWAGLMSPDTPAKRQMSVSVMVLAKLAF